MSAQLSAVAGDPGNSFHARLVLAAGVLVNITAPSMRDLTAVVAKLQPTEAVNDSGKPGAAAGSPASPTAAPSAQPAAAAAAKGEAGNVAAASPSPAAAAASTASTSAPSPSAATAGNGEGVTFDVLKKAFLALSSKANGRALCEGVLGTVEPKLGKLSEAKPEQYAGLMDAIKKAAG